MGAGQCCVSKERHEKDDSHEIGIIACSKALSCVRVQCKYGDRCKMANTRHWVDQCHPGDPDAEVRLPTQPPWIGKGGQLESRDGNFHWIRQANDSRDREIRVAAATITLSACRSQCYVLDGVDTIRLRRVDTMLAGTKLVRVEEVAEFLQSCSSVALFAPQLSKSLESTAMDAAVAMAAQGKRVAILAAASAYHPCGGFRTGGRHALEESMCMQSTLGVSLQRALWLSQHKETPVTPPERVLRKGKTDWLCYIPDDGVVFSPSVEVFREGSSTGYKFMEKPVELCAVVNVAMPNKNSNVKDSPLDAPDDQKSYYQLLVTKFKVALGTAVAAGAQVLVIPGVGCGIFANDPRDMGAALADAICWRLVAGRIREIVFSGVPPEFFDATIARLDKLQLNAKQ